MNRLENLNFDSKPTYNMRLIMSELSDSTIVPEANKYYTFVYKAKTPRITYDMYPLIICGSITPYGFNGLNQHWGEIRQYNFGEVMSNLYELNEEEFSFLQNVPLAYFRTT